MNKFFKVTLETLLRQMEFNISLTSGSANEPVRPVLLASPGFVAAGFQKYIQTEASTTTPALKRLLPSVVVVHSASGYTNSLSEVLQSPAVKNILADTKYARETKLMDDFLEQLRKETNKATYGPREVESAVDQGAVGRGGGVLIISNRLFRSQNVGKGNDGLRLLIACVMLRGVRCVFLARTMRAGNGLMDSVGLLRC